MTGRVVRGIGRADVATISSLADLGVSPVHEAQGRIYDMRGRLAEMGLCYE